MNFFPFSPLPALILSLSPFSIHKPILFATESPPVRHTALSLAPSSGVLFVFVIGRTRTVNYSDSCCPTLLTHSRPSCVKTLMAARRKASKKSQRVSSSFSLRFSTALPSTPSPPPTPTVSHSTKRVRFSDKITFKLESLQLKSRLVFFFQSPIFIIIIFFFALSTSSVGTYTCICILVVPIPITTSSRILFSSSPRLWACMSASVFALPYNY